MSKMRHLLRKLHIGGGGGDQHHHHVDQPVNPQPSGSSSTSSNSAAPAGRAVDSAAVVAAAVPVVPAVPALPVGTGGVEDFSVFEEEYQVQLALAISASDPDGLEDADAVQMKAAKRMSLGCTDGAAGRGDERLMEFLSLRYWNYNVINYDEKLADGFYDVCGIIPNQQLQGEMPSLIDLQATLLSDSINYVVVLVNRSIDQALQILESRAISISSQCRTAELGPIASGLVQKIADLVVESMGGPVVDAEDMSRRWTIKSYELQTYLNSIVLPIGLLEVGLSRHRALLFKVLADRVNLPCRLVKETCYTGTDEGAVNLIKINYDSEFIIDLMGAPGTLIPAEIPSSLFLDSEPSLLSSNITEQSAKDLCLALDKINCQFEKENEISEARAPIAFPSTTDSQSDEISRASSSLGTSDVSVNQINQTKRYESGFWELLPPSGGLLSDTSRANEAMPPAKQMKINDISKYVFSVDKDPELAQLQSVLLESGTRQNPDAFVDTTHAQEPFVQRNLGTSNFSEGRNAEKENQFPVSSFSLRLPSSLLPSTKAGPISCADGGNKEQNMVGQIEHNSRRTTNHNTNPPPRGVHSSLETCQAMVPFDPGYNENITELKAKGTCPFSDVALELTNSGRSGTCSSSLHEKPNSSEQQISSVPKAFGTHCFLENKIKENALVKDCQDNLKDFKAHFVGMGSNELAVLSLSDNYRNDQMLNDVAQWEILWEDLQIGERIGLGSCGEVYRADWNGTEVAVKKFLDQDLSGDAVEQFRCEVRIMLRLRHPNVVLFMGAVTRPPNLSILTEFLPRGSLFRLLHRPNVQLDEKRRLRMALDVAKGMNYLHTSHPPIVHRDLKTPNLLVDKNWVVKVCDFGLSKMKHHTFLSSNSTAGTPEWMAPEVLRNEPSNEKADVYSFGVILWELATLHMPWGGMNPMQVVGAVGFQNRRLDIPKEVDPMAAQIISDCWQSEPHLRPSFAQLMTPLKHLQRLIVN